MCFGPTHVQVVDDIGEQVHERPVSAEHVGRRQLHRSAVRGPAQSALVDLRIHHEDEERVMGRPVGADPCPPLVTDDQGVPGIVERERLGRVRTMIEPDDVDQMARAVAMPHLWP